MLPVLLLSSEIFSTEACPDPNQCGKATAGPALALACWRCLFFSQALSQPAAPDKPPSINGRERGGRPGLLADARTSCRPAPRRDAPSHDSFQSLPFIPPPPPRAGKTTWPRHGGPASACRQIPAQPQPPLCDPGLSPSRGPAPSSPHELSRAHGSSACGQPPPRGWGRAVLGWLHPLQVARRGPHTTGGLKQQQVLVLLPRASLLLNLRIAGVCCKLPVWAVSFPFFLFFSFAKILDFV